MNFSACVESESESESGEDEEVSLSDVNAYLNDSGEAGDESSEQPAGENGEVGEDKKQAEEDGDESNEEPGDESNEELGDESNEEGEDVNGGEKGQETTVNDNAQSGMCFFDCLNSSYFPVLCGTILALTKFSSFTKIWRLCPICRYQLRHYKHVQYCNFYKILFEITFKPGLKFLHVFYLPLSG